MKFLHIAIVYLLLSGPLAAQDVPSCRQALALAVDISGSVSADEHKLQRVGLASALLDARVQDAFFAEPGRPVRLMIFEWAGPRNQAVIIDWRYILSVLDLQVTAATLAQAPRKNAGSRTATGRAMLFGAKALLQQVDCERLTLDVSTDGVSNSSLGPTEAQAKPELAAITINGLAIGNSKADGTFRNPDKLALLIDFLVLDVIKGPDAFVEITKTFAGFSTAMRRKLIKELGTHAFCALKGEEPDDNV